MSDTLSRYADPDFDPLEECDLPDQLDDSEVTDDPGETLLDQLDRRQNCVLEELDELDARIQTLVQQCQNQRSDAA